MPFPVPTINTSESADSHRDERKRQASPPSWFYSQSQAILRAVIYFEPLHSGYAASAAKHKNRTRSALLVQLLAAFEFTMKDFIAQTLDATHVFDEDAKNWKWLEVDVSTMLTTREGAGSIGGVLIHPLLGWQVPETMNTRFMDIYKRNPIATTELQPLRDLWIVRHSIAHNGGWVTAGDARRLRAPQLANQQVRVDRPYIEEATWLLRSIVQRLETTVGPALLRRWFETGAARAWASDEAVYKRLRSMTAYVRSRIREVPTATEAQYIADLAKYPVP